MKDSNKKAAQLRCSRISDFLFVNTRILIEDKIDYMSVQGLMKILFIQKYRRVHENNKF